MPFQPEPAPAPADATGTAVLLCNLGTPDAPTAPALRRYLAQFLGDPRVVEIPRLVWLVILYGVILVVRPARSAAKYASIWLPGGSPLRVWTERQTDLLREHFTASGVRAQVAYAMRYGEPSIASQLDALKRAGARRVLILPLYPQYSASTTASVSDAVCTWTLRVRTLPEIRFVNEYHEDAGYVAALARRVVEHWTAHGRPDRLVLSFHGIPKRSIELGDPYQQQCLATARLLQAQLGLGSDEMVVTFQSRFGKAEWLQPYTEPTLVALAGAGVRRVDVLCPGFTSDCLETLEEIAQEARDAFLAAGGQTFHHIPCLNDHPAWIAALSDIARRHLRGWGTTGGPAHR